MIKTSVASVTFRSRSIADIARLARQAGIDAVEWGADVHVPPNDEAAAKQALKASEENGLEISAYGSYYRAGEDEDFTAVLRTAEYLGCRVIRVWAGNRGSAEYTQQERVQIEKRLTAAVQLAAEHNITVATEYHAKTLTDTLKSANLLLMHVPGLHTLWQPPIGLSKEENLHAISELGGKIENLHVYCRDTGGEKRPLEEGADDWKAYFAQAEKTHTERYATLEFVKDGSEVQFLHDAAVLHKILEEV